MKKKNTLFLFILMLCISWACSDDKNKSEAESYDPAKPIEVLTFMPDSGHIREKVIIKGSNFGNDISKVSVKFNDVDAERGATIVGLNNNTIYCMAPRQLPGTNTLTITVEEQDLTTEKTFKYIQAENVSTVAGTHEGNTIDGNLTDARFNYLWGVAALGNESLLLFQRDNPCVRLLSVPDNKVTTIHPGFKAGKPAVSKDKSIVYAVGHSSPHTVYVYLKGAGWAPSRIGQLGAQFGLVLSVALDDTEEWLYFVDQKKQFARFNIMNQKVEIISTLDIAGNIGDNGVYIIYNPVTDCFFMSDQKTYSVYKIEKNGSMEVFAGSSTTARIQDGYGTEAGFVQPNGMTVDEDGNLYIVEGHLGYVLRKITIKDSYVSTIAGRVNKSGSNDGNPIDARFNYPYDIAYDGEGNYWICEGWGVKVRKYAVE